MIAIETACRQCGQPFTPTSDAIRADLWRTCPRCRERAERLANLADAPPQPLPRHNHARDGPDRHPESFRGIERATGQIRPSERISRFSYHSKGKT